MTEHDSQPQTNLEPQMKRLPFATIIAVLFIPFSLLAGDQLQLRNATESRGAKVAQLINDFRDHQVSSPDDSKILLGSERHSFTGNARDLNRFLARIAELFETGRAKVILQGPEGDGVADPLTAAAAQTCAGYDWRVTYFQGDVNVYVPLAKDIPFGQIAVPSTLKVEAGAGAPRIASVFARLREQEMQEPSGTKSK